jgi:hypothetical protein
MKRFLALPLLLAWVTVAQAQQPPCVPNRTVVNSQGALADISVGATAIQVLDNNGSVCQRLLRNNGTAAMRCLAVPQGAPTATLGLLLNAGDQLLMGTEGRESWRCIRTTSTSTTATTIEGIP